MCSACGLNGRLGATKRRMLSLAEGPSLALLLPLVIGVAEVPFGVPFVRGTAEGILEQAERKV